MSKKKNCKRTPAEQAIHEEAVQLRKMTDKQLVEQFRQTAKSEMAVSATQGSQVGSEAFDAKQDKNADQRLLSALEEGRCKGIKSGIAYKVSKLAEEMGLT